MKQKKNVLLIISAILGLAYTIYLIVYFTGANAGTSSDAEAVGTALATALVLPHLILVALGTIFNIIAVFTNKRGLALTAGILYAVGALFFLVYALFVVPMIVLSFVGFAQLKKVSQAAVPVEVPTNQGA